MLVTLDASLADALEAGANHDHPSAIAVDVAAEALRQGNHVITGEVKTFDRLLALSQVFGPRTLALLRRARAKIPFRGAILNAVRWKVRIGEGGVPTTTQHGGVDEVYVPAARIAQAASLLNKSVLIAENANDATFYEALTREIVGTDPNLSRTLAALRLKYLSMPGGGQTIAQVYSQEKQAKEHFCLAIADSDVRYAGGHMGDTARNLLRVDSPPNQREWNARIYVIPVRAVENLFPKADLLRACRTLDSALGVRCESNVQMHWGKAYWSLLPIRNGLKCFDLRDAPADQEATFWKQQLRVVACPNFSAVPCADREDCPTIAIQPLGSRLLAKVCESSPVKLHVALPADESIVNAARDLCTSMISAFCGEEMLVVT